MINGHQLLLTAAISIMFFNSNKGMDSNEIIYVKTSSPSVVKLSRKHIKDITAFSPCLTKQAKIENSLINPLDFYPILDPLKLSPIVEPQITNDDLLMIQTAYTRIYNNSFTAYLIDLKKTDISGDWEQSKKCLCGRPSTRPEECFCYVSPSQRTLINNAQILGAKKLSTLCMLSFLPKDLLSNKSIQLLLEPILSWLKFKRKITLTGLFDHLNKEDYIKNYWKHERDKVRQEYTFTADILTMTPDSHTIVTSTSFGEKILCLTATAYNISDYPHNLVPIPLKQIAQFPDIAAITPDGKIIVIGSSACVDRALTRYNMNTNATEHLNCNPMIDNILINSNGKIILTTEPSLSRIHDLEKGECLSLETNFARTDIIAMSSDGKITAIANRWGRVLLSNFNSENPVNITLNDTGNISSMTMTSNGKILIIGGKLGLTAYKLDNYNNPINLDTEIIHTTATSLDGNIIVAGSTTNVIVCNIRDLDKPIKFELTKSSIINSVSISEDGSIVTVGYNQLANEFGNHRGKKKYDTSIEVYDISDYNNPAIIFSQEKCHSTQITGNGKKIVSIEGDKLILTALLSAKEVKSILADKSVIFDLFFLTCLSSEEIKTQLTTTNTLLNQKTKDLIPNEQSAANEHNYLALPSILHWLYTLGKKT